MSLLVFVAGILVPRSVFFSKVPSISVSALGTVGTRQGGGHAAPTRKAYPREQRGPVVRRS